MVTVACPFGLISLPLIVLSPEYANTNPAAPQINIIRTATGRLALEKLGAEADEGADFALASRAAYNYWSKTKRDQIIEIGEIIHHNICSSVYSKTSEGETIEQVCLNLRHVQDNKRAIFLVQSQTIYNQVANEIKSQARASSCEIVPVAFDRPDIEKTVVDGLAESSADYIICLGMPQWLDVADEALRTVKGISTKYRKPRRHESGMGVENYSLFAWPEALASERAENLKCLREIVLSLHRLDDNDPTIVCRNMTGEYHRLLSEDHRENLISLDL